MLFLAVSFLVRLLKYVANKYDELQYYEWFSAFISTSFQHFFIKRSRQRRFMLKVNGKREIRKL